MLITLVLSYLEVPMKIISWNCNMKFRDKFQVLPNADVYVIQECENPKDFENEEYKEFASNFVWIGTNKNKGLGIFAKQGIKLEQKDWNSYCLRYFLQVSINDKIKLLGVWTLKPYIEEYYIYQSINMLHYDLNTIIIGDFNSNSIWDKQHFERNHTAVAKELERKGLQSIYHFKYNENQGEESIDTFYLYRHLDKGYHIDHCFANPEIVQKYEILTDKKWIKHSDHLPILLQVEL